MIFVKNRTKKLFISILGAAIVLATVIGIFAAMYVNARIVFNGMTLVRNGDTTQTFIDIRLKNINTTGLSFCLQYDKNYLTLSDASTNEAILPSTSTSGYNLEHQYFKQNEVLFPEGCFINISPDVQDRLHYGKDLPVLGSADVNNGYLAMNFIPFGDAAAEESEAIEIDENGETIIKANSEEGVLLGSISFAVNNPSELSKLSQDELNNIIQIVPFASMDMVGDIEDTGVNISYLDEDGTVQWYTRSDKYINYEINLNVELSAVTADVDYAEVTSADIYRDGTIEDLIYYLNKHMNSLTLEYTDNKQVPATFKWDTSAEGFECYGEWNPKGGYYTITQPYNDVFKIEVDVKVLPVELTGFYSNNQYISYVKDSENFPATLEELELPQSVKPILEPALYNDGIKDIKISWYEFESGNQLDDLPDDFKNGVAGAYEFSGILNYTDANLDVTAPWLTYDPTLQVKFIRYIVDTQNDLPKEIEVVSDSYFIDENGALNITIRYTDGAEMTDATEFQIRLPNGEILDTSMLNVEKTFSEGAMTIVAASNIKGTAYQKQIAEYFNLGSKLGDYSITAKEESSIPWGEFETFTPLNRTNTYTETEYEFDYSDLQSGLFNVSLGELPSTTITLPAGKSVSTTYDGYDGSEPGALNTFKVDNWEVTDGTITQAGEIITIRGALLSTSYTNYGMVSNTQGSVVIIKYLNSSEVLTDTVDSIDNFTFNKQQYNYGYDKLQTAEFTLSNIGNTNIEGIYVDIGFDDSDAECFVLSDIANKSINAGESTVFAITTKHGLPVGVHTAKVTVSSNRSIPLVEFNITFEVVENEIYTITVLSSNPEFGEAKTTSETYTAEAGENIRIDAKAAEDCQFTGWTCDNEFVNFEDAASDHTSFEMPAADTIITANFAETTSAYLRLTKLQVINSNDDTVNILNDSSWKPIEFSPTVRQYYVSVPNNIDTNKILFSVREEGAGAEITVTHKHGDGEPDVVEKTFNSDENYYTTDDIELEISPTVNLLTIQMTYDDNRTTISKQYDIYIYRKIDKSDLITPEYGNSPYGLIMRSKLINDKSTAKNLFKNKYMFDESYVPEGGNASVRYRKDAWEGVNYDTDDTAVFVINNAKFVDPGWISLTDSIGQTVEPSNVSRSITVNVLAESDVDYRDGSEDDFTYISSQTVSITASAEAECDVTELKDLRIRPDIYQMKYTFEDFDGSEMVVNKPIIILSLAGDLNIDNTADAQDADNIFYRFESKVPDSSTTDYSVGGRLYRYRVCDTNWDGNINAIDANVIVSGSTVPFYTNMEGGHEGE